MNVFHFFKDIISIAINNNFSLSINLDRINLEYPKDKRFGDMSTNAAIIVSKLKSLPVSEVAQNLVLELSKHVYIQDIHYVSNGLINFTLKNKFWLHFLKDMILQGDNYPVFKTKEKKVNVEFVSANPTGPLHIGHVKSAVFGDVISNVLDKCGYEVTREYYLNDSGTQIDELIESLNVRYLAFVENTNKDLKTYYQGEYLIRLAKKLYDKYGSSLQRMNAHQKTKLMKKFVLREIIVLIKKDLYDLGVKHDLFTSETEIINSQSSDSVIRLLQDMNLIYRGHLEKPKTQDLKYYSKTNKHVIFRSTKFGDDKDRVMIKSNNEYTYFASDVLYHADKISRGYDSLIVFLGSDHIGYEKRITGIVKSLGNDKVPLRIKFCQLVKLKQNDISVKMSKRLNNFVSLRNLLDSVGPDALRFEILKKSADTPIDFDVLKLQQKSKDNPIFYVQYASSRIHSLLRKAESIWGYIDYSKVELDNINSIHEIDIIKNLAHYPKILEASVKSLDPHKIVYYIYNLSQIIHQFWNVGKINHEYKFINESFKSQSQSRMALVKAMSLIFSSCLNLLGVKPLKKM